MTEGKPHAEKIEKKVLIDNINSLQTKFWVTRAEEDRLWLFIADLSLFPKNKKMEGNLNIRSNFVAEYVGTSSTVPKKVIKIGEETRVSLIRLTRLPKTDGTVEKSLLQHTGRFCPQTLILLRFKEIVAFYMEIYTSRHFRTIFTFLRFSVSLVSCWKL